MTKNQKILLGIGVVALGIYLYKKNQAKTAAVTVTTETEEASSFGGRRSRMKRPSAVNVSSMKRGGRSKAMVPCTNPTALAGIGNPADPCCTGTALCGGSR